MNVVCKEEMYILVANTSGQISLQLSSFCSSLKTKNKTDPENLFWKNYHRWQCLFVYLLDNAHNIIYLHFIFTQKLPCGHFYSNRKASSTAKRETVTRGLKQCKDVISSTEWYHSSRSSADTSAEQTGLQEDPEEECPMM